MTDLRDKIHDVVAYLCGGPDEAYAIADSIMALLPGWQPIETAPKDGTRVLLYRPGEQIIGYWWRGADDEYWNAARGLEFYGPTHWRSLPEPPEGI